MGTFPAVTLGRSGVLPPPWGITEIRKRGRRCDALVIASCRCLNMPEPRPTHFSASLPPEPRPVVIKGGELGAEVAGVHFQKGCKEKHTGNNVLTEQRNSMSPDHPGPLFTTLPPQKGNLIKVMGGVLFLFGQSSSSLEPKWSSCLLK